MNKPSALPIQQASLVTILGAVAASILLVLPFTDSFIAHTKTYLLFATALLVAILFLIRVLKRSSFDLVMTPFTGPLALFGGAVLVSTFLSSPYPVEHLLGMGGVYIAMVVIALLGGSLLPKHSAGIYLATLSIVGSILLVLTALQFVGVGPAQWLNSLVGLDIPRGQIFNLSGSGLVGLQFALVGLVGIGAFYKINKKLPNVLMATAPILAIAVVMFGYSLLPGQDTAITLPSFTASWSVALDAMRNPQTAIIGVGPENYTNVYAQFKPVWVNMQDYWAVAFSQAANVPLTILTTMGFLGLIAWSLIALAAYKAYKAVNLENRPLALMIAAMLVLQLILPANVVMLTILAITIAVLGAAERHKLPVLQIQALSAKITNQQTSDEMAINYSKTKPVVSPFNAIAAILLVGAILLTYMVGRTYAAHFYMNESNKAAMQDDGVKVYELQQQAVRLNPYLDVFRRRYAYTNMVIAAALSNKADASEREKEQVSQLLQQAISEARAATILDPADYQNFLTLAQIYEQMMGVSEEAEQWAVQSYVAAIERNPMDPGIRLALGNIFLGKEDYSQAASIFNTAVEIKADFPNSYFNLAIALEGLNQLAQAQSAYQQVLSLIEPGSEDYKMVSERLAEVTKALEAASDSGEVQDETADSKPSILEQNLKPQQDVINNADNIDLSNGAEVGPAPETIQETGGNPEDGSDGAVNGAELETDL